MTFFLRPETVSTSAPRVTMAINSIRTSSDGFVYLATVLHKLLPQFGGPAFHLLTELKTLHINDGEELDSFHERAQALQTRITLSRVTVPPTLFFSHYLAMLNTCPSLVPHLSTYNRDFAEHIRTLGDMVPFPEGIEEVYEYLVSSRCPVTLRTSENSTFNDIVPSANYGASNRRRCEICDGPHTEDDCHKRGFAFMPPSVAKKAQRYNEIHGHTPKVPKKDVLQKPFKACHQKIEPEAKMVEASAPVPDIAPISDVPSVVNTPTVSPDDDQPTPDDNGTLPSPPPVDHSTHAIRPAGFLAEFANVDKDYMDFLFPSGSMAEINLARSIPANYISHIEATACTGETKTTKTPLLHHNSTSAEQDELFVYDIFKDHSLLEQIFHADWGANIIIVNKKEYFTEFIPCEDDLNPINGIPIAEIKGYGTVIFKFGNNLVPVREIAYMPDNPHCTMRSSHLQRLNGFLPGIHSMHSSVKLTNGDGQCIKFIPIKRNGLDYINIIMVIPSAFNNRKIRPTACKANVLSPQLIPQKCGHFFNERIEELARRELVDGLPKILPKMNDKCPICLLTKSNHHPRRPPY